MTNECYAFNQTEIVEVLKTQITDLTFYGML